MKLAAFMTKDTKISVRGVIITRMNVEIINQNKHEMRL